VSTARYQSAVTSDSTRRAEAGTHFETRAPLSLARMMAAAGRAGDCRRLPRSRQRSTAMERAGSHGFQGFGGDSVAGMVFTDSELAYLGSQRLGRLATVQAGGTLQVSPVGFSYNPATSTIDISGHQLAASQKLRNIADNGRVAFVVDDLASVDPWRVRCIEIRGVAEALGSQDVPLIRIHPKRVISFGIDEPDTPAHSLTVSKRTVG